MRTATQVFYVVDLNAVDTLGGRGIGHVVAMGDATPLCGRDDDAWAAGDGFDWSGRLTVDYLGSVLVDPPYATCGTCCEEFWRIADEEGGE